MPTSSSDNRTRTRTALHLAAKPNLESVGQGQPSERDQLQRKCDYLDAQIDRLVYELYGLTEDEIKIVEGR